MFEVRTEEVVFHAADGAPLSGLLITPERPRYGALVSSGTGFPKTTYRRFAQAWAERRGAAVLIYDYRGIAGSAPPTLKGSPIEYTDWGRLDMPAAVETLAGAVGDRPLVHAAHSVGGHFLGFMPNHDRLSRHAFLAVGTGYWGRHHWMNRPRELFFWGTLRSGVFGALRLYPRGRTLGRDRPAQGRLHHLAALVPQAGVLLGRTGGRAAAPPFRRGARAHPLLDLHRRRHRHARHRPRPAERLPQCAFPSCWVRKPGDYGVRASAMTAPCAAPGEALWPELWNWLEVDMEPLPA
jgi:hypothetical protein